jgi:HSP20 family protein
MYNRDNQGGALSRRPQQGLSRESGGGWFAQRDPWQEMMDMQRRVDRLFSHVFGQEWPAFPALSGPMMGQMQGGGVAEPDIDISESDATYTIKAALPGIQPEDINVQATGDSIRLTAQSRTGEQAQPQTAQSGDGQQVANQSGSGGQAGGQQAQPQNTMQHRQGQFSRVSRFEFAYSLPEEIDPNAVRANFRNGVLELSLPKVRQDTSRNKAITIPIQGANQSPQIGSGSTQAPAVQQSGMAGDAQHQAGARSGDGAATAQSGDQSAQRKTATAGAAAKAK